MLTEIAALNGNNALTIFDARNHASATANRMKGGGFEDERYYPNCRVVFCGIDNIHAVTSAFNQMFELHYKPDIFNSMKNYGDEVESTNYMQLISIILQSTN